MKYEIIPVGPLDVNCVILWEQPEQAWLADPGGDAEVLFDFMARRGLKPACVLLTHGHCDHIGALDAVLEAWPVPVYMAAADAAWAFTALNTLPGL
ncbi:MAG: MBL fold metallo-hydrolase, partial [Kiritimatiellaeota bacterium]|nr:MBL fold metallo-hydrolase [Kiritimatiellota bacterium]